MSFELILVLAVAALAVAMFLKHRTKPVDMNHQAPLVNNVQMEGRVGPATAADKAAAAPKKK